jgi:uncharacterized protein
MNAYADLVDYRRRVHELYARVRRAGTASPDAFTDFVATRDALFARHPQSPVPAERRAGFAGLAYHAYDGGLRFVAPLDLDVPRSTLELRLAADGVVALERFAQVVVPFPGAPARLSLYWVGGYGGGLFLPFRDATNGTTTYGGGRYLLDTIKGADLGSVGDAIVLDFNSSTTSSSAPARPPPPSWPVSPAMIASPSSRAARSAARASTSVARRPRRSSRARAWRSWRAARASTVSPRATSTSTSTQPCGG